MTKRVLITGAGGMLGKDIVEIFARDKRYNVFGTIREKELRKPAVTYIKADLTNTKDTKKVLSKSKPNIIIHCAAIVNLDICEKNKKYTDLLHIKSTEILSSHKNGSTKFVYISSDSVFNGKTGNYTELDKPDPLNYYAHSKRMGEQAAMANNKNALIIRTNIYGFHIPPGNSLVEWALNNFALKNKVNGFTDVIFNPVYTKQLARTIKYILENHVKVTGILNVGSTKPLSKYAFLRSLSKEFGFKQSLIRPVSVDDSDLKTPRPKNTTLNIAKLTKIVGKKGLTNLEGFVELKRDHDNNFGGLVSKNV